MSRNSVSIAFLLVSLNELEIFARDIGNIYLFSKCGEKLWTESGKNNETEKGVVMIISRALYRINSYGAARRENLVETLRSFGYN